MRCDSPHPSNWQSLRKRLHGRSFLSGPLCLARRAADVYVLRSNYLMQAGCALFLLLLAGLWILGPLMLPGPQPRLGQPNLLPWDDVVRRFAWSVAPVFGVLSLLAAVYLLLRRDEAWFDGNNNVVRLRWGIVPFTRSLEFPVEPLQLHLYQSPGEDVGFTSLGLTGISGCERLKLTSNKWRSRLAPIYQQLRPLFEGRATDSTETSAPDISPIESIHRTPIQMAVDRGASRRLVLEGDYAVLRGRIGNSVGLLAMAVVIGLFTIALDQRFGMMDQWTKVIVGSLATFLGSIGIYLWPWKVVLRKASWLQLPQCAKEGSYGGQLHASDVVAVQICAVQGDGEHVPVVVGSFQLDNFIVHQVNLVAHAPAVCRVNLICDTNPQRAEAAAKQLADLLDVRVVDHR